MGFQPPLGKESLVALVTNKGPFPRVDSLVGFQPPLGKESLVALVTNKGSGDHRFPGFVNFRMGKQSIVGGESSFTHVAHKDIIKRVSRRRGVARRCAQVQRRGGVVFQVIGGEHGGVHQAMRGQVPRLRKALVTNIARVGLLPRVDTGVEG